MKCRTSQRLEVIFFSKSSSNKQQPHYKFMIFWIAIQGLNNPYHDRWHFWQRYELTQHDFWEIECHYAIHLSVHSWDVLNPPFWSITWAPHNTIRLLELKSHQQMSQQKKCSVWIVKCNEYFGYILFSYLCVSNLKTKV